MSDLTPLPTHQPASIGKLVFGVILAILGVLFTLDNFGLVEIRHIERLWPVILIALGAAQLAQNWRTRPFGGIVLLVLGVLFLLRNYRIIDISLGKLIPLVFVVIGLRIAFGAISGRSGAWDKAGDSGPFDNWIQGFIAFGGLERRIASPAFRGGDIGAFCGGWELDLSKAKLGASREARLDVFAWWGGGEIRIPEDWNVVVRIVPLLAGYGDKTRHPAPGTEAGTLVVTGTVIMGGVEIKN
ncbi:MAG: LiaI-LiaF-like domain-containing protein [Thermoanaerobaculia bacterium]